MKKKLLALVLSLAMVSTVLVGCGAKAEEPAPAAEPAVEEPAAEEPAAEEPAAEEPAAEEPAAEEPAGDLAGKKVGVTIYKFDDNFMTLYRNELENMFTAAGAEVTIMDGKNDQAEQSNQIDNFISQGVDVLVINLVQSSAAEQIADKCHAAGIPAVFINREPEKEEQERWAAEGIKASYVGADASQSGTFQGEMIVETENGGDINGDGKVGYIMVQGDPENVDAQMRTEFSVQALVDAGIEVDELDKQRGDWDQTRGQEITANALTAHGDAVEVVFCNNDAMALGAAQAIEAAGRTVGEDIYLVGVDALVEALELVVSGGMTGTVFNDHMNQAGKAVEVAAMFLADAPTEVYYRVDYVKATKDVAPEVLALLQ